MINEDEAGDRSGVKSNAKSFAARGKKRKSAKKLKSSSLKTVVTRMGIDPHVTGMYAHRERK